MEVQIIYTSKYGCTAGCAQKLGALLPGAVLYNLAEKQPDIERADAVILGAPVYAGMPPKAMRQFIEQNRQGLLAKRLGLFICCSSAGEEALQLLAAAYGDGLVGHATRAASFGGLRQRDKMKFMDKTILKMVAKSQPQRTEPIVDEQAIEDFARCIQA